MTAPVRNCSEKGPRPATGGTPGDADDQPRHPPRAMWCRPAHWPPRRPGPSPLLSRTRRTVPADPAPPPGPGSLQRARPCCARRADARRYASRASRAAASAASSTAPAMGASDRGATARPRPASAPSSGERPSARSADRRRPRRRDPAASRPTTTANTSFLPSVRIRSPAHWRQVRIAASASEASAAPESTGWPQPATTAATACRAAPWSRPGPGTPRTARPPRAPRTTGTAGLSGLLGNLCLRPGTLPGRRAGGFGLDGPVRPRSGQRSPPRAADAPPPADMPENRRRAARPVPGLRRGRGADGGRRAVRRTARRRRR